MSEAKCREQPTSTPTARQGAGETTSEGETERDERFKRNAEKQLRRRKFHIFQNVPSNLK